MFVIQQTCRKRYECTTSALELELSLNSRIIYILKPFLRRKNLAYLGLNLYLPIETHDRKDSQVLIAV